MKLSSDRMLGLTIQAQLINLGIETPMTPVKGHLESNQGEKNQKYIEQHFANIMSVLGLNLDDDSLKQSPKRVARMYCQEIFEGLNYENFPTCTTFDNKMQADEMIATKSTLRSMCEHHFVPFIGEVHMAYIPNTKILGLSKFNRIANFFCRRPQVQERLTLQIAATLSQILETPDIAVVTSAVHYCTHLRGVQDQKSVTVTSKMTGKFLTVPALRAEFLALTRT